MVTGEPTIETKEIVAAIRDAPAPVVNTRYLADEFDTTIERMKNRLTELVEEGVLEHTEARNRGHLWWLSVETEMES
ncbi:hypothetical protein SAMN05421858_4161 [Haladaptatus litoreus]|uniref:FaeA-like protein n=1 Tax=Haladaptatus litoreus TaxID=553468 RepID=A0A1N7EAB8_9EURY|nr:hypothetical protein [Haladaptatus litoreus]SIR85000.1 hypothetical protein SAMN05421858_4161 [Haladaptatus litoreus]